MTMTLRLSDTAEQALDRIVRKGHLASKTAAIEMAIAEMDARSNQVDRAAAFATMIATRDAELFARLADA